MPGQNLTRIEAQQRAALIEVDSYEVTLDLTTGEQTFRSTTVVKFRATDPGASTFIDLIAPTVREVEFNGDMQEPAQVFSDSRISLYPLAETNTLRVVADCAYSRTGEGLHRFVDPVDSEVYLYTQFEVADSRRVFAVFEQPDLKATFQFTVTAPAHWQVVSNSPAPEPVRPDGGPATWVFAPTPVLPCYVTAIVAGPYHRVTGELTSSDGRAIPLSVACRASLAEHLDAEEILDVTTRGFAFYEESFDYPYPYAKYDQIFVPEFNAGAMENAGAVTLRESYVFRSKVTEATVERRAITILHELAHMWFGDLVTMRWWNDLWLNESFAEYASHVAAVGATRWTEAWTTFSVLEKSWAYRQDQLISTHPIVAEIRDLRDVEVNFDGITYAKGASVLRQLVAWVGTEAFWAGLRTYFRKHAWRNTELRDLLTELEATSGRDLTEWSRLWLEQAGITLLRPALAPDGPALGEVVLVQEVPPNHPVLRPHRLAVGAYTLREGTLTRDWRVEIDAAGPATPVEEISGRPRPDLLLVNDEDLAYTKIRFDEKSLNTVRRHLRGIADPLARALVWSASWDMTRDAQWPARDWIALVLDNIGAETHSTVVTTALRQVAEASRLYVATEHRIAARVNLAGGLKRLMLAAEPGSDNQLQFLKAFARQALVDSQLDTLEEILAGDLVLEGLAVDTDLRWELLEALVVAGRADEADIARTEAADPTATGAQAAASARAAIPTPEAKEAAWHLAVESDDVANAIQVATVAGFNRVNDRTLLTPFVTRYFESIEGVYARRSIEMASNVVEGLYPEAQLDTPGADLLARTDEWLRNLGGRTPALGRMVAEARDEIGRALQAQECDRVLQSAEASGQ